MQPDASSHRLVPDRICLATDGLFYLNVRLSYQPIPSQVVSIQRAEEGAASVWNALPTQSC